jgi:hypothetical protein
MSYAGASTERIVGGHMKWLRLPWRRNGDGTNRTHGSNGTNLGCPKQIKPNQTKSNLRSVFFVQEWDTFLPFVTLGFRAGLLLAGFCVGAGLGGLAVADQPSAPPQALAPSGTGIRSGGAPDVAGVTVLVFDAETRLPLATFYLTPGRQDREKTGFEWTENRRATCSNGYYSVALAKDRRAPAVKIEADGYLPQRSGPIRGMETNLTFLLKKGGGPKGVVLTPDGQPAGGRTVYLPRFKEFIYLTGAELTPKAEPASVRRAVTDAAGRFSFAPGLEDFVVVVADEAGFAEVRVEDLKQSPEVRLQPWARLEGRLKVGVKPGARETVRLADAFAPETYYPRSFPPYAISVETTTDAAGRFVFARVPPVGVKVFHAPKLGRGWAKLVPVTQITNLTLAAGEKRELTLGGQGRRVVGRLVVKNFNKPIDWQDHVFWMESLSPPPPDCPSFEAATNEFHRAWKAARDEVERNAAEDRYLAEEDRMARQMGSYYATPAGRRYWFSKRSYVL